MSREPKSQEEKEESAIKVSEQITPTAPKIEIPEGWKPRTRLGKDILENKITDIKEIFEKGIKITEPEIVDVLIPNLEKEIILVGGSTGKGGGIRRTPFKRTTRMHKSGRRYRISVMSVVGNKNGYVGLGFASGPPGKHQDVIQKSVNRAKLNVIPIRRGCGSWECLCGTNHSIPLSVRGNSGSVEVILYPAPKGIGLVVSNEIKKIMKLAGISDIWSKSRGQTATRVNHAFSAFYALRKLNKFKTNDEQEKKIIMGKAI